MRTKTIGDTEKAAREGDVELLQYQRYKWAALVPQGEENAITMKELRDLSDEAGIRKPGIYGVRVASAAGLVHYTRRQDKQWDGEYFFVIWR